MAGKQQSSIDRLPADILERLQELLRDPRVTQLAATAKINAVLEEDGHRERLSKSAVNRYDLQMREAGARLRQSREVAAMWIGKLGAAPQGQVGNLVNEILRTLAFDLSLKLQETDLTAETMPEVVEMLRHLSLSAMRLEKAASENVKREEEIRKQTLAKAAEQVSNTAKKLGVSPETIAAIHREVLGI
jgi:hypothetical protein